ncbi:hypothetical protein FA13DRAFT_1785028 [Coprinellus micaceus]|uniref:Uncharacterized protein n=1 Tax=Coprinellus micaceus TaxID=71717 RepID=A0A4Y7TX38_COPMI|nr:hypothetical protein FA13DRAFT_1785028 [Coprinellus micaceus]
MKIPSSSSVILATLAISSSSASLAAPTGEVQNNGSSLQQPHARQVMDNEEKADAHMMERDLEDSALEARDLPILSEMLGSLPVVGPMLKPLLVAECSDPNSAQAASSDPAALQRLEDAIGTVSSALTGIMPTGVPVAGLPLPLPSGMPNAVPGGAPTGAIPIFGAKGVDDDSDPGNPPASTPDALSPGSPYPSGAPSPDAAAAADPSDGGSFLISPTTTIATAEEATSAPQDPDYLSAGDAGTPTSPGVPSGPPNTPVPVNTAPASD